MKFPFRSFWMIGILLLSVQGCGQKKPLSPLRLVAMGDSLTAGLRPLWYTSYPHRLEILSKREGRPVTCVKNMGSGGYTVDLVRLNQIPYVSYYHPDIVSFWIGTNDILNNFVLGKPPRSIAGEPLEICREKFERDLKWILEALEERKIKYIFLGKIHDLSLIPIVQVLPSEKRNEIKKWVDQYNEIIERAAKKYPNVWLVPLDQLPSLKNPRCYMGDGIHPRPEDHKSLAKAFWKVMRAAIRG